MTATGKLTMTELEARYLSGGERAIKDYYRKFPVLVILPDGRGYSAVTWTPHATESVINPYVASPSTPSSGEIDPAHSVEIPKFPPGAVVAPITGSNLKQFLVGVGRLCTNDIQLQHKSVSRNHARFDFSTGRCVIEDLNSKNGTHVDGLHLLPGRHYLMTPYREVRFGEVQTMFLDCQALLDVCQLS